MTSYTLQVHPITAKILNADFGMKEEKNNVFIPASDAHATIITSTTKRTCSELNVTINIHTHLKNVSAYAGANLYHYHKRRIFEYVLANMDVNANAMQSIRTFYAIYDIEDDDYDMDSMYREWVRYYTYIRHVKTYPTPSGTRRTIVIENNRGNGHDIAAQIVKEHLHLFYNVRTTFNMTLLHQLLTYVTVYVDQKIPTKLKRRTRFDRIAKWKRFMDQRPEVRKTYEQLVMSNV